MQNRAKPRPSSRRLTKVLVSNPRHRDASSSRRGRGSHIRYAVVGAGHIAQVAVLPAFKQARRNSKLVALFSDDPTKRRELRHKYNLPIVAAYEDYDKLLE